ncbi:MULTISPECIES: hypothetical protein [Variovorax]|uniref:hypothetical protein n=1 Tax=Variovorax TaxID=34072 RepID=UPI00285A1A0D|nr:hypothetical protein [Variovorax sp. 3319]MDR6890692.1 hypothetical protein [Variovorax sp. 3319]
MKSSINKSVGIMLDGVFAVSPSLSGFEKVKALGPNVRRFIREDKFAENEIVFYRDKWWTSEKATLYADARCLVHSVQLALSGQPQSLRTPNYDTAFHHFQYAFDTTRQGPRWSFDAAGPNDDFAPQVHEWVAAEALPWLNRLSNTEAVVEYMCEQRSRFHLSLLLWAMGDRSQAHEHVRIWLRQLHRQIEPRLARLAEVGLISKADEASLVRSSIQMEERYRSEVESWILRPPRVLHSSDRLTRTIGCQLCPDGVFDQLLHPARLLV